MQAGKVQAFKHDVFGTCIAASCDVAKGEVVLKEKALLLVPSSQVLPPEASFKTGKDARLAAMAFARAPPHVRSSVLSELYIPDTHDPCVQETTAFKNSKMLAQVSADHLRISPDELLQGLLAFNANAHGFRGGQAVFKLGSKLAHTCNAPSTEYKTADDGYGCHIALRNIKKGELLTTSYIDNEHILCSTRARQDFIRDTFMFTCRCDGCASVDYFRGLPCPLCLPPGSRDAKKMGFMKMEYALGKTPLPGVLYYDPNQVHTGKPWTCNTCGTSLEDQHASLGLATEFKDYVLEEYRMRGFQLGAKTLFDPSDVELSLERQVLALETYLDVHPVSDLQLVAGLLCDCCGYLGPAHWTVHRMHLIYTECKAAKLRSMFCMLPPIFYEMMWRKIKQDATVMLNELEDIVYKAWGWVDSLPPPPTRRSTPFLIGNTVTNIMLQLARCVMSSNPQGRLEPLQRRMAALVTHYVELIRPWLEVSYVTWEDRDEAPEIVELLATPRFQAFLGEGATGGPSSSGLDSMRALESFLPRPQASASSAGQKKKKGKKGKGHKKKGH